jgi:hypothetical protein
VVEATSIVWLSEKWDFIHPEFSNLPGKEKFSMASASYSVVPASTASPENVLEM